MAIATERRTWESRAEALTWRVHSSTRETWHLVTYDGEWICSCEWAQNGGLALKDCKHVAAARLGLPDLPRPCAIWTDDETVPTAREWAEALELERVIARGRAERECA